MGRPAGTFRGMESLRISLSGMRALKKGLSVLRVRVNPPPSGPNNINTVFGDSGIFGLGASKGAWWGVGGGEPAEFCISFAFTVRREVRRSQLSQITKLSTFERGVGGSLTGLHVGRYSDGSFLCILFRGV